MGGTPVSQTPAVPPVPAPGPGAAVDPLGCGEVPQVGADRDDYTGIIPPLTDPQWARLQAAFPVGVCDYSLPGVGKEPSVPWMKFACQAHRTDDRCLEAE